MFFDLKDDEIRDWLNAPVTRAYLDHLKGLRTSFEQDALSRARKHEPASYETGKADGIDDAISIAGGKK